MKILIASSIDPATLEDLVSRHDVVTAFGASSDELAELVVDREVVIFRSGVSIAPSVLEQGQSLQLLIRAGSGLDNIDLDLVRRLGLRMVRIPRPSAQAVAEFALALILDVSRNVSLADRLLRDRRWPKTELAGTLIDEKTLGIVGAGNIGARLGELAAGLGMQVLGCVDPRSGIDRPELTQRGVVLTTLPDLLERSDIVSVHTPLSEATRGLIGAAELALMPRGSYLVSTARGGVVDEDALYDALVNGHLRGAALDVHEQEGEGVASRFADLPQTVLTPHIGAMAEESQRQIGDRIRDFVDAWEHGRLDSIVDPIEDVV